MRVAFFFVLVLTSVACVRQSPALPMKDEQLVAVLEDIHLAEAALQNVNGATKDSLSELYYRDICTIHKLDQETLDETLALLRKDPVKMSKIYSRVLEHVSERN